MLHIFTSLQSIPRYKCMDHQYRTIPNAFLVYQNKVITKTSFICSQEFILHHRVVQLIISLLLVPIDEKKTYIYICSVS